ncbi:hypothetical protein HDU92_007380, partial [Lobulomyces angularis]
MVNINELKEGESEFAESDSQYETDEELDSDLDDESDIEDESLLDRLAALTDVIPHHQRQKVWDFGENIFNVGFGVGRFLGTAAWILTTGAMVLILPGALEIEKEHAGLAQEHQMRVQQQQAQQ